MPKPTFTNQRLFDLVRHQRMALHTAELITNDEYAELAQEHAAVARLEDYDQVRAHPRCPVCKSYRLSCDNGHQWEIPQKLRPRNFVQGG